MDEEKDPLPDPVAYARGLSDAELHDYRRFYGDGSREWLIAKAELSRRRTPPWLPGLRWALAILIVAALAYLYLL